MYRIDDSSAAASIPTPEAAGPEGFFTEGNPVLNIQGTRERASWFNMVQEELRAIVMAAGLTPSKTTYNQVLTSIETLIEARAGNYALDSGTANAYVIALSPAITSYSNGLTVRVLIAHANTGASTLDAGGGVVALVNDVGSALVSGDLPSGCIVSATYIASSNKFMITSLVASQAITQAQADARYAPIIAGMPPGTIIDFAGTAAPAGYLVCPTASGGGQLVPRATYAALFAAIGTTWGAGDGSTTFGIPWFAADYTAVQANANVGSNTVGQVIAHTHTALGVVNNRNFTSGGASSPDTTAATSSTGGSANLAAGVRLLKCVKY